MPTIEGMFLWIGSNFNAGLYLTTSKMQVILWSAADVVLVLAVLKIVDLARGKEGLGRLAVLYWVLWLSALLTPLLLLTRAPRQFFLLECVICGSQFSILLYVACTEKTRVLNFFSDILQRHETAHTPISPGSGRSSSGIPRYTP